MKTINLCLPLRNGFRTFSLSTCPLNYKGYIHSGIFKIDNKFCCFHETEIDPSDIATLFLMGLLIEDDSLIRTNNSVTPDKIYRIKNAGIFSQ